MSEKPSETPKPNQPANIMGTESEKPAWEREIAKKSDLEALEVKVKGSIDELSNLLKAKPSPEPQKTSQEPQKPNQEPQKRRELDMFGFEI